MTRWLTIFLFFVTILFSTNPYASPSPAGLWLARSPLFGDKPLGIVKIYITRKQACGELLHVYPLNGVLSSYRKRISSGPIVLCGYNESEPLHWTDGKLYEQTTARLYPSEFTLTPDGKHLYISGYSGVFSKTAVWDRIK